MIIWIPTVLSDLYACVLYFCICTSPEQLCMFHKERRSRNTLITVIIATGLLRVHTEDKPVRERFIVEGLVHRDDPTDSAAEARIQ